MRERVDEPGERGVALGEGRRIRVADTRHRVPVRAAGRQRERPARAVAVQPALRVERVEEPEEVVLARAAAVDEDERALGFARGGPLGEDHVRLGRGSGSGVSRASSWLRSRS